MTEQQRHRYILSGVLARDSLSSLLRRFEPQTCTRVLLMEFYEHDRAVPHIDMLDGKKSAALTHALDVTKDALEVRLIVSLDVLWGLFAVALLNVLGAAVSLLPLVVTLLAITPRAVAGALLRLHALITSAHTHGIRALLSLSLMHALLPPSCSSALPL